MKLANLQYRLAKKYEDFLKRLPWGLYKVVPYKFRCWLLDLQWSFYRKKNKELNRSIKELKTPVLFMSVPKSGTHIIQSFLSCIPGARLRRDLCETVYLKDAESKRIVFKKILSRAQPGHVYFSHLPFDPVLSSWLDERGIKKIFIYRDPRDVLVSLLRYVMEHMKDMHIWYDLLKVMASDDERLMHLIQGTGEGKRSARITKEYLPNFNLYYRQYLGWIQDSKTFVFRFEEIVNHREPDQRAVFCQRLQEMLVYLEVSNRNISEKALDELIHAGMDPEKSSTFYKGQSGVWKQKFTEAHHEAFHKEIGDLLIDLGYQEERVASS